MKRREQYLKRRCFLKLDKRIFIVTLLGFTLLFKVSPALNNAEADGLASTRTDSFRECKVDSDCTAVETESCCQLTSVNKKFKQDYLKQLYGDKEKVTCDCAMPMQKSHCTHEKCELRNRKLDQLKAAQ